MGPTERLGEGHRWDGFLVGREAKLELLVEVLQAGLPDMLAAPSQPMPRSFFRSSPASATSDSSVSASPSPSATSPPRRSGTAPSPSTSPPAPRSAPRSTSARSHHSSLHLEWTERTCSMLLVSVVSSASRVKKPSLISSTSFTMEPLICNSGTNERAPKRPVFQAYLLLDDGDELVLDWRALVGSLLVESLASLTELGKHLLTNYRSPDC